MKNFGQMMKQAQEMQNKMAQMQESLSELEVVGSAGGGLVEITLSGKNEARQVKIDPTIIEPDNLEMLEDLIVAAINNGRGKIEAKDSENMAELTGGLQLPPGFKLPL